MINVGNGPNFEADVRATAAALWELPIQKAAAKEVDGQEIDCVCETDYVTHLVMATTSSELAKAKDDIKKLERARYDLGKHGKTAAAWLITEKTPTRDQREAARTSSVTILSLADFRSRLLDSSLYFSLRRKYAFGSAVEPKTGSTVLPDNEYVDQPIADMKKLSNHTPDTMADLLVSGHNLVLLGHYGAGKSVTVRQVFMQLAAKYEKRQSDLIPMALNLRQHWGQTRVTEAIRRHAEDIGLPKPDQLVRAWNAGKVIALLDGFDELTYQGGSLNIQATRENRRNAVSLVRAFSLAARGRVGILVTGRMQYFDTASEMHNALGIPDLIELELDDFTDEQALRYLRKKGPALTLPAWLPRRPLLIGYLASAGLLDEILSVDGAEGPSAAWQQFLPRIAQREAEISPTIDPDTILHLLEHVATVTRSSSDESGTVQPQQLLESFRSVTFSDPSDQARVVLSRLPGLNVRPNDMGGRSFVDVDMLDALRGRWVARFIADSPNTRFPGTVCLQPLGELGYQVCALTVQARKTALTLHVVAAKRAVADQQPTLALDCLMSGARRPQAAPFSGGGLRIQEGEASVFDFVDYPVQDCYFDQCTIRLLRIGDQKVSGILLRNCLIEKVDGVINLNSLPDWVQSPDIGRFDEAQTTAALMALPEPLAIRVLLTVLHKLFEQRGAGRKETALLRGIPQDARTYVPNVLAVLQRHGLAKRVAFGSREVVWHPERAESARAGLMLVSPRTTQDAVLEEIKTL